MNIQEIPTKKVEKPRVCAYVRVSTDSDAQEDSFAFQSNYWQEKHYKEKTDGIRKSAVGRFFVD
ncbi:MAG: hypothetical protein PHX51_07945 [Clostridia bacterium]|nr:hypothetical protein [Clostridia bacterium]